MARDFLDQPSFANLSLLGTSGTLKRLLESLMDPWEFDPPFKEAVIVAGGFGNYLNIEKAIMIGLLPDLSLERFQFIGNSSLSGARMALMSNHAFEKAQDIAKRMTYLELSVRTDLMNEFIAALFLPHTNQNLFPSLRGLI